MTKRVLLVGSIPPPYHGSNIMCESFLNALKNTGVNVYFVDKRFSFSISEMGELGFKKILVAIKVLLGILRIANKSKPSVAIVFISTKGYAIIFEYLICRILYFVHIPYIIRMGGYGYSEKSNKNKLVLKFTEFIFHHADRGIVLDEILKKDVIHLIPSSKLIVVPNTLEDTIYIKNDFEGNEIKLLYCSNLLPGKGALEFINSVLEINMLNKFKIKATIIGDYQSFDFFTELLTLAKQAEQIISFKGLVIGDEKLKIFAESDIFIFPTYYELETFGLVNLEAMRAGLPVVTTNWAAIPKVVIDNQTGFIVPPRDIKKLTEKIILLIENKSLRIKFGFNGRARYLEHFSSTILEKKLKQIIDRY